MNHIIVAGFIEERRLKTCGYESDGIRWHRMASDGIGWHLSLVATRDLEVVR